MAISFDTSGKVAGTGNPSTATLSYTVGNGSAKSLMIIAVSTGSIATVFNAPIYNGVTATFLGEVDDNSVTRVLVWYINNPTQGSAHNVVVSVVSGGVTMEMFVSTYLGANIPSVNSSQNTGNGTSLTLNLTTGQDNSWTAIVGTGGGSLYSAGTGTTVRQSIFAGTTGGLGDSNGVIHPAGSTSLGFSWSGGSQAWSALMFEIPIASIPASASDIVTASDSVSTIRRGVAAVLDTITASDTVSAIRRKVASILDTITASDIFSLLFKWTRQTKHSSTETNQTKHTSIWTDTGKDSSSFNNQTKH